MILENTTKENHDPRKTRELDLLTVGSEIAMKGVLLISVKLPVSPGGAFAIGAFVGPGIKMIDWPLVTDILAPGISELCGTF